MLLQNKTRFLIFVSEPIINNVMTFHVHSADKMRDIEKFINEEHIAKEDIISILQDSDKNYVLTYFA